MDRLEHYLDQICRSIGGPRSLREHVRQELREHLLDAVAQHKAAGLPDEEAMARALTDFGRPEELRSELEATHGHRMLALVIDRAMQWKEMTMRAKWLWTTWAYLSLVAVLALEVLFITFMVLYIVPKFQKLMHDGMVEYAILEEQGVTWMPAFLNGLMVVNSGYTTFFVLGVAALWGLFEWRVTSENKTFMRLSVLGTAAAGLLSVVVLTAGTLVISFTLAMPALGRMARPFALEQVSALDTSVGALEQSLAKEDWTTAQEHADQASSALHRLARGPALTSLTSWNESPTVEELQAQVSAAHEQLRAAQQALVAKDTGRVHAALGGFRKSFGPVRDSSRRPVR
jgi:hypothetical protein